MQLIDIETPPDLNIFDMGDRHYGSSLHDYDGWDAAVEMIHSPYEGEKNNHVILKGDDLEGIQIDDPRFTFDTTESRTLEQMHMVKKATIPIAKQIDCMLTGNHEFKLQRFGDINKPITTDFGVRYGTYAAKLTYKHKGKPYLKCYVTHGAGSVGSNADDEIRRKANMQLSLKRKLFRKAGDCHYMSMGHCHKLLVAPPTRTLYLIDDGKKLKQMYTRPPKGINGDCIHPELRWYGASGSFMKSQAVGKVPYSERMMLDPVELGFLVILVRGGQICNVREEKI